MARVMLPFPACFQHALTDLTGHLAAPYGCKQGVCPVYSVLRKSSEAEGTSRSTLDLDLLPSFLFSMGLRCRSSVVCDWRSLASVND